MANDKVIDSQLTNSGVAREIQCAVLVFKHSPGIVECL